MALANFFDKSSLAASQILRGYDASDFKSRLLQSPIELAFDKNAISCKEGVSTLDICVRLLARLYPVVVLTPIDGESAMHVKRLTEIATSINPDVDIVDREPAASVVVGDSGIERINRVFYVGSHEWVVNFSTTKPATSGNSNIPFAAGAAACFGAANIFRLVFGDQLERGGLDSDFQLSLLDFNRSVSDGGPSGTLEVDTVDIGETVLVGLGAIGNGMAWALSRIENLTGTLDLVDPEVVDITNLQRYVLARQSDKGVRKVEMIGDLLSSPSLTVRPFFGDWASFLAERKDWSLPTVAVAVDNAVDRIAIQASLPKDIINAWTQPTDLAVSRHYDFLNDTCLACLYRPPLGRRPESVLIADALGLPHLEPQVRDLVYNNAIVNQEWLEKIAEGLALPFDILMPYVGLPIREFYHTVICGGVVLKGESNQQMETPMAFQSALAGILLASELTIRRLSLRKGRIETATRINLLRPLGEYLNDPILKVTSENCICGDPDFRFQYAQKYNQ
jgi:hypothetical protein